MPLDPIKLEILKLIRDVNDGEPVGLQPLDRRLVLHHSGFIFSGKLQETLADMEANALVYATGKGYLLTDYGKEFLV